MENDIRIVELLARASDGKFYRVLDLPRGMREDIAKTVGDFDNFPDATEEQQPQMGKIIPFGEPRKIK